MSSLYKPAIFLDRDGTINEDVDYLSRPEDLRLLPGAGEALRLLQNDFVLIVITNQSGIARGLFDEDTLSLIHQRLDSMLAEYGVRISRYYYCPHHPDFPASPYGIECDCRKPKNRLFRLAAQDYNLDLNASWAIGDKLRDCTGAMELGCRGILLSSDPQEAAQAQARYPHLLTAPDLGQAARLILSQPSQFSAASSASLA